MGKRLRVHKKHVIEYADREFFNWKFQEFQELLEGLGCDTSPCAYDAPDDWEVDKDDFERALDILKKAKNGAKVVHDADSDCDYDVEKKIMPLIHDVYPNDLKEEALNKIVEDMQYLYDNADKETGYIYFSCF